MTRTSKLYLQSPIPTAFSNGMRIPNITWAARGDFKWCVPSEFSPSVAVHGIERIVKASLDSQKAEREENPNERSWLKVKKRRDMEQAEEMRKGDDFCAVLGEGGEGESINDRMVEMRMLEATVTTCFAASRSNLITSNARGNV